MSPIGFSTGALAKGDFRHALRMMKPHGTTAVEFSALRVSELDALASFVATHASPHFQYVSFHAPSAFPRDAEAAIVGMLGRCVPPDWPVIVHPDTVTLDDLWRALGPRACFENMDKRKPAGRTCEEMRAVFDRFPDATFCFDIAHAHQIDPTMAEARRLLTAFGHRLREVHFSEVDADSAHRPVSEAAVAAFKKVAHLIPPTAAIILEADIDELGIERELRTAREVFGESIAGE